MIKVTKKEVHIYLPDFLIGILKKESDKRNITLTKLIESTIIKNMDFKDLTTEEKKIIKLQKQEENTQGLIYIQKCHTKEMFAVDNFKRFWFKIVVNGCDIDKKMISENIKNQINIYKRLGYIKAVKYLKRKLIELKSGKYVTITETIQNDKKKIANSERKTNNTDILQI